MNVFLSILKGISLLCLLFCLLGLWRPWLLLWWLDQQNRLRVLIYYGIPGLLAAVLYMLLSVFE